MIDWLNDASGTLETASQEFSVHQGGDDTNRCQDTHISIPDYNYTPDPSRASLRGTLSRTMDQVRSLLPESVVHTRHVGTAPPTAVSEEKRVLNPIQDMTHVDPPLRSARIRYIHREQEPQRTTYYLGDVTIDMQVTQDTTPPQSTCKNTPTAQQTPEHTVLPPLYDKCYVATYNIGGADVTPDRFHQFMTRFHVLPHMLNLQEIRPSATSHATDFQKLCRR